jgi:hypothetical protein
MAARAACGGASLLVVFPSHSASAPRPSLVRPPPAYRVPMACLLSEELWLLVFEQILDSYKSFGTGTGSSVLPGGEAIRPLLLVCRQWQVCHPQFCFIKQDLRQLQRISEPLMYRHVQIIRNPAAARMLSERIFHLSATRNMDVWRWVWTFYEIMKEGTASAIPLFMRAVNLIEVQTDVPLSAELLVTLRQSCPSLRSLKVWIDTDSHRAVEQVGLFEHVEQLRIVPLLRSQYPSSMDRLTNMPGWNMPAVTNLWWRDHWNTLPHGAGFISRCRFPHLTRLDIRGYHSDADNVEMPHICRFLDAHRSIISLRLWVKDDRRLSIVPSVRARNLQLGCVFCCPPRAFVSLMRPEVKTLELEFTKFSWEHHGRELTTSLWELLTQFVAENDTPPTLEAIRLTARNLDAGLCDNPMKEEKYLHTLRSHVLGLSARGIRISVGDTLICV